jgi:phosphoserine phosphatase RsbU/P
MFNDQNISLFETQAEKNEYRLHALLEITRAVTTNQTIEQLTRLYSFILREQIGIDRFILFNKEQTWNALIKIGVKLKTSQFEIEKELSRFKDITVIESSQSSALNEFDVVIPVIHKDKPLAYLLISGIGAEKSQNALLLEKMRFAQTLSNIVVLAVENRRMTREQLKQERLKKDLEVASEMQRLLFPSDLPSDKRMDISAKYIPRHDIGGDYYDFIPIGNDKYIICIADVSGKGISAAMLMANFQATIRTFFTTVFEIQPFSLDFLIHALNKKVLESAKGEKFITLFVAQYDATTRELEYVNAGHSQPFITNGKQFSLLEDGSVGLGMFDELPFLKIGKETLSPNTTLVLYTDGVVELENNKKQHFDLERLVKIVHNFYKLSMEDMNEIVFSKLDEWRGKEKLVDDTAVFSCRFF